MSPLFFEKNLSDITKEKEKENGKGEREGKKKRWEKAGKAAKKGVNDFDPEES